MDAKQKIEAALAAVEGLQKWGPLRLDWKASKDHGPGELGTDPVIIYVDTADVSANSVDVLFEADWGTQEDADFIEACNPIAIREVLQTLASKDAEVARLKSALELIVNCEAFAEPFANAKHRDPDDEAQRHQRIEDVLAAGRRALTQPTEQP